MNERGGLIINDSEPCPWCEGNGHFEYMVTEDYARAYKCSRCGGQGEIEIQIEIPEDDPTFEWFDEMTL